MNLLWLVWQNLIRNRKNLVFSSIGLVVGVSTFVFFVALGQGVKEVVLEEIFQIRQLEVVPRSFDFAITKISGARLNPATIERFREIPGVVDVYPKMKLTFPSWVMGGKEVLGKSLRAEAVADGLPPAIVRGDLPDGNRFRDWEAEFTCTGEGIGEVVGCPEGRRCLAGTCAKQSCNPEVDERYDPCEGITYCAEDTHLCEMPIPVVINPALLAVYNSSLTTAISGSVGKTLPKLTEEAIEGIIFEIRLGKSNLGQAARGKPVWRQAQIVGFSDKAIQIGFTIPIQYARRFNAIYSGRMRDEYHSVILVAESNDRVAAITKEIGEMGFDLDSKHAQAERLGLVITIVTMIFTLISLLIVCVSAINIAHTFFMIIAERRREIGILRAIGANRWDIRILILGEAVLLGLFGGLFGVLGGWGFAMLVDRLSANYIPDFPFKPDSFFIFESWILVSAVFASIFFSVLGAYVPARQAANMEPSRAFSTQ